MTGQGAGQILVYPGVLLALAYPLGAWMTRVYQRFRAPGVLGAAERGFYRLVRIDPRENQDWRGYGLSVLVFSALSTALLYLLLRAQGQLPLNPDGMKAMPPHMLLAALALGPVVEALLD